MNKITAPLQDFMTASRQGGVVWVEAGAAPHVHAGNAAPAAAVPLREILFDAIAHRYGEDAALLAWREAGAPADARSLPAATLAHVIGCAESMGSLADAQGLMLQMEWSASLLGRRFVALCRELGLAAAELPLAHRQAIDEALRREPSAEPMAVRMTRHLLQRPLH